MGKQVVGQDVYKERNLLLAEALESGEYTQTSARLRDENGFCCLGVACDVYKQHTGKGRWTKGKAFQVGHETCDDLPPSKVVQWFGWREHSPEILVSKHTLGAATQNDDKHRTFKQIAKGFRWLARQKAVTD